MDFAPQLYVWNILTYTWDIHGFYVDYKPLTSWDMHPSTACKWVPNHVNLTPQQLGYDRPQKSL